MSEVFEDCESRFSKLSVDLFKKLSSALVADGENKRQEIIEIISEMSTAKDLIRKMDIEARSLQANVKAVLLAKIREYQSDMNNLKNEVKQLASTNLDQDAHNELLEAGMGDVYAASETEGDRNLTTASNTSGDRVEEGREIVIEGQELGVPLLQDLHQQQKGTDTGSNGNMIHGMHDEMGRSNGAVDSMPRKICRWTIGGIIGVLLLTFCLILYFIF